ncbi:MAG: UDP-N-acetylmuramate--alanine ligase [Bacteroidales bacterium]|nr:UDP-N-acetylmuramate--alanine ligase [Bacteroidales bacterium]
MKNILQKNNFFFVGIAGTGMSAIAQYLRGLGKNISGSDRIFVNENKLPIQNGLEDIGITCFFQDGSGISSQTEVLVVSTAIENTNPEVKKALELNLPIIKRSELLAAISDEKYTIAIGGTSGKSTTTAMIFHILQTLNLSPSLITGAGLTSLQKNGLPGNAYVGESEYLVIEADESDGSIVGYKPQISVLLNIDRDHKELDELITLFETYKTNTKNIFIVNNNQKETKELKQSNLYTFGTDTDSGFRGANFTQKDFAISFTCNDCNVNVPSIGKHNMENALAAIAASHALGIAIESSAKALSSFEGIYRRTQLVGKFNDITVIDDFAHNPAEIRAALQACQIFSKRVFAWFQPHGFGPLKFMQDELVEYISQTLRINDVFYMSDVYYAGGTVDKTINSDIIIEALKIKGSQVYYIKDKYELSVHLKENLMPGDTILLMGARDPFLNEFAIDLFNKIQ